MCDAAESGILCNAYNLRRISTLHQTFLDMTLRRTCALFRGLKDQHCAPVKIACFRPKYCAPPLISNASAAVAAGCICPAVFDAYLSPVASVIVARPISAPQPESAPTKFGLSLESPRQYRFAPRLR